MNVLFLELQKVINNSSVNLFNQRTVEGTVYNTNPSFVNNLNKLIKDHELYLVLTSHCKGSIAHEDVLYVLNSLGIDSNRFLATLFEDDSAEKMKRIQTYFDKARHQIENYLVLDNYENIQPSPAENIFLVANGLNDEEYAKCDKRIKTLFTKQISSVKNKPEVNPSKELDNCSKELIQQQNQITLKQTKKEQDTNEALYLLNSNPDYFKSKHSDDTTYVAREKVLSYLLDKFPQADKEQIENSLTRLGFIRPSFLTKYFAIPASLVSLVPYHFFTDLTAFYTVAAAGLTFVALDVLTWCLIDNKVVKVHTKK